MAKYAGGVRGNGSVQKKPVDQHAESRKEFESHGEGWEQTYFDEETGGYLATEQERLAQAEKSKQERAKYDKEKDMCMDAAKDGHKVEHLQDREGRPDASIDGELYDLKETSSHNNIESYAKHATREQGASRVYFKFTKWNKKIEAVVSKLSNRGIHGLYTKPGEKGLNSF